MLGPARQGWPPCFAEQRANVIQLDHDQFKASGHYTNAVSLGVTVETNGPEHIDRILAAIQKPDSSPSASTDSNTAGGKPRRSSTQYLPLAGGWRKSAGGWLTDNHQLLNPPTGACYAEGYLFSAIVSSTNFGRATGDILMNQAARKMVILRGGPYS